MRLFCAVELPAPTRAALASDADRVRQRLEDLRLEARWTREEKLHITLWFLGELNDAAAADLAHALARPFPLAPFGIRLGGLGTFPPAGPPRVVWVGVRHGAEALASLHRELAGRLAPLGHAPDRRPFHPHVTLARVRNRPAAGVSAAVRGLHLDDAGDAHGCQVSSLALLRSHLSPRGSRYDPMLRVPLAG